MKLYDMHIHDFGGTPDPEQLLERMQKAGIYGGCIFSQPPHQAAFEERLERVLAWTNGYPERLFPVMWIHPYEQNVMEKIQKSVDAGICGFKMICADYYVYEEGCMEVLRKIASLDKPVFFHSGILWDGKVSSLYNRPLNWEALMDIEGLRFSMGHCSWPWIDECVALYGKFLNSLNTRNTAEMFFDITPGTPDIYRRELMTKLFEIGYDVGDNVMFGCDACADTYSNVWVSKWLDADRRIMDDLGVCKAVREKLYYGNLMRFLGKTPARISHSKPQVDEAVIWNAENPEVRTIIEKWYKELKFPKQFDREFYQALRSVKISDTMTPENFDTKGTDGARNLLTVLFMCEGLEKKYAEKGISREILLDTLQDIVTYTRIWTEVKGTLYLGELEWLSRHLTMRLFQLGRLQFCMATQDDGKPVVEIHIPEAGALSPEACDQSLAAAEAFFGKYYPEFDDCCYTCHSWLLDSTLLSYLDPQSNIVKFRERFELGREEESDILLRYIFRWDTNALNVRNAVCTSGFSEKIKRAVLQGVQFHETWGVLRKRI